MIKKFRVCLLISILSLHSSLPLFAMNEDDIDTAKTYRIISKTNAILSPYDLRTRLFTEGGNFGDFCFKFIRGGAESYRIKGIIRDEKEPSFLNVTHAFWPWGDKSVERAYDDGTWIRHRTFFAKKLTIDDENYYQFINEESSTLLGIDTNTGRIKAFKSYSRTPGDSQEDQEDNKLFRIEFAAGNIVPIEPDPEPLPIIPYVIEVIEETTEGVLEGVKNNLPFGGWIERKLRRKLIG